MGLQGLDDEGTESFELISKLQTTFDKLGISLSGADGQLRSSYDILYDLNGVWGTLDKNTKTYIAELVAGKNQIDVFNALMSNFSSTISANETALNSAGSAAKENSAYMESLEAKVSALKQSFQELSNSIVDNDLVATVLDIANGLLQIADTPVGKFILLATGITAVIVSVASLWNVLKLGETFLTVFAGGAKTLALGLGTLNIPLIATIAGISALVAAFPAMKSWLDVFSMSLEETNAQLSNTRDQLEINKQRIQEINGLPWNEKTQEILNEKDALAKENEELEKQIEKLDKLRKKKAEDILKAGGMVDGSQYKITSMGDKYKSRFDRGLFDTDFDSYEQLVNYLDKYIPNASSKSKAELESLGITFKEVTGEVYLIGDAYQKALIEKAKPLIASLKNQKSLTEDQVIEYEKISKALGKVSQAHIEVGQSGDESVTVYKDLIDSYQTAIKYVSTYVNGLINEQVQAGKTGKELYNLVEAQIAANNAKLDFSQQIQALKTLAATAGVASELISSLDGQSYNGKLRKLTNQGMGYADAKSKILNDIWGKWSKSIETPTNSNPAGEGGGGTKTATDPIEEQNKLFKEQISILEDRLVILQKSGASEQEQLAQLQKIQQTLHEQAEWYRSKGLSENSKYLSELGKQWWDYQDQIKTIYDNIAKAEAEARKASLESQQKVYESFFSLISDNIDKEITVLEEKRTNEEKRWDAKIQALQDENAEIERQIELETLQSNLAQARDGKVMVLKDGRFQYAEDIDAISQAQSALDSYNREENLRRETENLETLKNEAIQSIDDQIEKWQDYKEEWSSVVSDYQSEQDKLLIEQQLGIKLEGDNWQTRLNNLAGYVAQYKSLMSSLSALSSDSGSTKTTTGTPSSGGSTGSANTGTTDRVSQDIKAPSSTDRISQDIGGRAANPNKYANGTLSAEGGLSLVGENGPEFRVLDKGNGIIPSDITKNLWALGSNPYAYMASAYSSLAGNTQSNTNYSFTIDKLQLPYADAPSLINGLKNYAYQYSKTRK